MAENGPLTPEKQLLKLIENPKQASLQAEAAKREGKKWFSISALKGRVAFWKGFSIKRWFSFKKLTKNSYGIRQVNLALKILIGLTGAYLIYSTVELSLGVKKASNLIFPPEKGISDAKENDLELKSVSYYLEKTKGRNIFNVGQLPEKEVKKEEPPAPAEASDRTKDYSLVGIAWSDNPEAMIEDKKDNKTYFVKRGQPLSEGVKVVTIFRDKVILSYEEKEFELR